MRISELSRRSGVPITTIKHYLREGLLPPGRATAATQADYGESHLRRLRLIRALIGVRGLSISATRDVLSAVSEHEADTHQVLGLVLGARPVTLTDAEESEEAADRPGIADADALLSEMGWDVSPHAPAKQVVAETLETLRSLGLDYDWRSLLPYADPRPAHRHPRPRPTGRRRRHGGAAERAVLLTLLLEPALLALRRLAQEDESAKRYGG